MDSAQSALDSLRTVEFRETLKGYHRDDVDEYLEKAAVEAEALQEQLRQAGERLRQAGERVAELETALKQAQQQPQPQQAAATPQRRPDAPIGDDTLQRTLILAQKFVDETKADSEARASKILADATAHARSLTSGAETKAAQIAAESESRLREDINRLEGVRGQLSADVEAMARHLESERNRLRSSLTEVIKWVDDIVEPATALVGSRRSDGTAAPSGAPRPGQPPVGPRPGPTEPQGNHPAPSPAPSPAPRPSGERSQAQSGGGASNGGASNGGPGAASLPLEA